MTQESTANTQVVAVDMGSFEHPIFIGHKRGRNWVAVVTGRNAANCEKRFLKSRGTTVDLAGVDVGAVLEVAGDYTTSGGRFDPTRLYWHVVAMEEESMTVEPWPSLAKAMKAAHKARAEQADAA